MHAYQIAEVRYQNFGPFADVTFDFAQPGLTVIDGAIDGFFGCDSNGAGKSFLFDGVAWALFGRCLRERYTGDDIRRHVWSDRDRCNVVPEGTWTCVTVTLTGGNDTVSIARYRKHPTYKDTVRLVIDGEDRSRGTTPQTTEAIIVAIGMDFHAFCNSVAFAAREDIKSFLSEGASDGERKQVLEKILGLELYAVAQQIARGRLRERIASLDDLAAQQTALQVAAGEKQALLADLRTPEDAADLTLRITRARVSVRQLQYVQAQARDRADQLEREQHAARAAHAAVRTAYRQAREDYRAQVQTHRAAITATKEQASALRGRAQAAQAQASQTRQLGGQACPTCQKTLTTAQADRIITALTDTAEDLEQQATRFDQQAAARADTLDALPEPARPAETSVEEDTLQQEYQGAYRRLRDIETRLRVEEVALREMLLQQERTTGHRTKLQREIAAVEQQLRTVDAQVAALRLDAEMLEFWVEGFGNQGLKSFLIEAETPRINQTATRIAQRLLGPGTRVRLNATRQLKTRKVTREQLTIDAVIPGCTNTYAGASRAQKKRLDLALILAFREVVAGRAVKGFRQLFADEVFDGMDESGVAAAGDLLRELASETPVAVISHHPEVRRLSDHYVTVYHHAGKAVLRNGASQPSKKQVTRSRGKRKGQRRQV